MSVNQATDFRIIQEGKWGANWGEYQGGTVGCQQVPPKTKEFLHPIQPDWASRSSFTR